MHCDDVRIRSALTARFKTTGHRVRGTRALVASLFSCALVVGTGCSKSSAPAKTSGVSTAAVVVTPGDARCPATGRWAECSVLYRLDRAGVGPRIDSSSKADEKSLHGESFVVKIGQIAKLDVFLYPDSAARIADAQKLDRTQFVNGTAPQTMRRERTLIENGNLVGLFTSLNERQRERVSDALNAGAPQPNSSTP